MKILPNLNWSFFVHLVPTTSRFLSSQTRVDKPIWVYVYRAYNTRYKRLDVRRIWAIEKELRLQVFELRNWAGFLKTLKSKSCLEPQT